MSMQIKREITMTEMVKKIAMAGLTALLAAGVTMPSAAQQAPVGAKAPRVLIETEAEHRAKLAAAGKVEGEKKPGEEGITVHGHWIIDVKNPDGSLAEHRDFYNALDGNGGSSISRLLLGVLTPETFSVTLFTAANKFYQISVPGSFDTRTTCSLPYICVATLTQGPTTANGSSTPNAILLSGQVTPSEATVFNTVYTSLITCGAVDSSQNFTGAVSNASPAACRGTAPITGYIDYQAPITFTGITPLSVAAGQTLLVTVTISFS